MCQHQPRCPQWPAPDHLAARIVADHPEQGWSLLCNGVVVFDDGGEVLPDGHVVAPDRPARSARFAWPARPAWPALAGPAAMAA